MFETKIFFFPGNWQNISFFMYLLIIWFLVTYFGCRPVDKCCVSEMFDFVFLYCDINKVRKPWRGDKGDICFWCSFF